MTPHYILLLYSPKDLLSTNSRLIPRVDTISSLQGGIAGEWVIWSISMIRKLNFLKCFTNISDDLTINPKDTVIRFISTFHLLNVCYNRPYKYMFSNSSHNRNYTFKVRGYFNLQV